MHINVNDILAEPVGTTATYNITNESLQLADISLVTPVNGQLTLIREEAGIGLIGQAALAIELECHRCLQWYTQPLQLDLRAKYVETPNEDQLPVEVSGPQRLIDIMPVLRDEVVVCVPIQQVCTPDCQGLCDECGQVQSQPHNHPDQAVKGSQIKITSKD